MKAVWLGWLLWWIAAIGAADERAIILASTTSAQNSGLYDAILPIFTAETGIRVHVVAVGTGQAIRIARNGDADLLLIHHRPSEEAFVASGFGLERRDVMYNEFVIVGPGNDPAKIAASATAVEAFARIAAKGAPFASRGDDSGTDLREQELWGKAGVAPDGAWYLETGSGMGATLNYAAARQAYTLSDRGTWAGFGNKQALRLLFEGDPALINPYSVVLLNPARFPHLKADLARELADWLVSDTGQQAIAAFRISGKPAFCPARIPTLPACNSTSP